MQPLAIVLRRAAVIRTMVMRSCTITTKRVDNRDAYFLDEGGDEDLNGVFDQWKKRYGNPIMGEKGKRLEPISDIPLDEPGLGERWQDRLVVVFLVSDFEQIVRSYDAPSLEKYVPIRSPVPPFGCVRLRSLPFPASIEDDPVPMSPGQLCDHIAEIKNLLSPFTSDLSGLVSQILRPNVYGYDLAAPEIAYQGGSPMLIQEPHDPDCDHCHQPMRFLFQFGEIIPGLQLADAGVGYVYGCDHHPHPCKAFIDSH